EVAQPDDARPGLRGGPRRRADGPRERDETGDARRVEGGDGARGRDGQGRAGLGGVTELAEEHGQPEAGLPEQLRLEQPERRPLEVLAGTIVAASERRDDEGEQIAR